MSNEAIPREWSFSRIRLRPTIVESVSISLTFFGTMAVLGMPIKPQYTPIHFTLIFLWNLLKRAHPAYRDWDAKRFGFTKAG